MYFSMVHKNKKKFEGMNFDVEKRSLKDVVEKLKPDKIQKDVLLREINHIKSRKRISPRDIAAAIMYMAETNEKKWDTYTIMDTFKQAINDVNWRDVYSCIIEDNFNFYSLASLYLVIDCWVHISGIITVPYELFFKKWKNPRSQILFLKCIIESDEKKTQLYSNVFFSKILTLEESKNHKYKNPLSYESNFNCIEFFECLKTLDSNMLVDLVAKKSPEWCLVGLSYIQPSFVKTFDDLLLNYTRGTSSNFVFYLLFRKCPDLILRKFQGFLSCNISLSKILDILLEHKMLNYISEALTPKRLCFDILILSSKRDHLNLNIWTNNSISQKKDAFVKELFNYIDWKINLVLDPSGNKDINASCVDHGCPSTSVHNMENNDFSKTQDIHRLDNLMCDRLFPLTVDMVSLFIRIVEMNQKILNSNTISMLGHIKKLLSSVIDMKKHTESNVDEQAGSFISAIINSQVTIDQAISQIAEMQKNGQSGKELCQKIFATLIDNYSTLYKLPNSDILAKLYGLLVQNKILTRPYVKVILNYIKGSLTYPESDREFSFAFKCLEVFVGQMPNFLSDIEDIDAVKINLLKKDLILVDEKFYTKLPHFDFFKIVFKDDKVFTDPILSEIYLIIKKFSMTKNFDLCNAYNDAEKRHILQYIIKMVFNEETFVLIQMLNLFDKSYQKLFILECLDAIKLLLNFQIDGEIDFSKKIGLIIGRLTLSRNTIISLEYFDFKRFLVTSVECRRILLGVTFICSFLRQAKYSLVFRPNNPWLMSILNLLAELHSCTLKNVRKEIESTFLCFNMNLEPKHIKSFKFKTKDYLSDYILDSEDPVLKHIISLALDFSVREISPPIIEKACEIAVKSGVALFKTVIVEKGNEFVLFRNLLINLTKALCFISSQEPMRACMSGNISYFSKLASYDLEPEKIYKIVSDNQNLCCQLIKRAGVSKVNDCIGDYFKTIEPKTSGSSSGINLEILENTTHIEKISIKQIEFSEYQDIKAHFLQLSRKSNKENSDFVSEEWHSLLGHNREFEFNRIYNHIANSEDKDQQSIKLCKYITGHLIKTSTTDDFLYKCLKKIFKISFKTQKEVLGWLIYSNGPRRFSVDLVSKFIQHKLINLVEYDQTLAKIVNPDGPLDFVVDLLSNLITSDVQICTVYDFVSSLEVLANHTDKTKVYDFFQRVCSLMMVLDEHGKMEFDLYVKKAIQGSHIDQAEYANLKSGVFAGFNIFGAFKSSWEHFIRHHKMPTEYCYNHIDILAAFLKNRIGDYLKEILEVFITAYSCRNYLFIKLYTRFWIKLLNAIDESPESRMMILSVLDLLAPSNVPFFITGYLEIVSHRFIQKYFESDHGFSIAEEVLRSLEYSPAFIYPVTRIFGNLKYNIQFFKKYGIYLSFICPAKYIHLKNIFNRYRDNISYSEGQNNYFKIRRLLQCNSLNIGDFEHTPNFVISVLENLNEKNIISINSVNVLTLLINNKTMTHDIIFILWMYNKPDEKPCALKAYYDDLKKYDWFIKAIELFDSKFNK